jgi:dephospho-CoA kinase
VINVGVTGGIGSGKSEVTARLARQGAVLIDADGLAREAVAPGTPGLAAVVARFGPSVLAADGSLDRAALARVVFADDAGRRALEAIVHPYVEQRTRQIVAAAPADAVVVHDVPLLVENELQERYDMVVVVDAPVEAQLDRLVGRRGMSEEDARARLAAQASREERLAAADVVLDNSGDLAYLSTQVDGLWRRLRAGTAS